MCAGVQSNCWVVWLDTESHRRADSMDAHLAESRRTRVRTDIANRLQRVCSHLAEQDFRQLVDDMTERQIKGEQRVVRDFLSQ
jgi:hypothetical protein